MSFKKCIGISAATLIILFILVGLPIIIYYEVVRPKNPTFTLEHASVTGFNITSDNHLTAFFNVTLVADNRPNHKLKLKYSSVRVEIFKNKQRLAVDALKKFTQRKRNVTLLTSEAVALYVKLKDSPAFHFRFESGLGYIGFDVFMTATLNSNNLEVNCKNATVNIAPLGIVSSTNSSTNGNFINNNDNFRRIGCSVRVYSDDS